MLSRKFTPHVIRPHFISRAVSHTFVLCIIFALFGDFWCSVPISRSLYAVSFEFASFRLALERLCDVNTNTVTTLSLHQASKKRHMLKQSLLCVLVEWSVSMISNVHSERPSILFKHLQNCLLARTVDFQLFISNVCYGFFYKRQMYTDFDCKRRKRKMEQKKDTHTHTHIKRIQYSPTIFRQKTTNYLNVNGCENYITTANFS